MIRHHWLRWWAGPIRKQIVPWTTVDQVWWHEMLPTGVIGLSLSMLNVFFFWKQIHVCVCIFYYPLTLKLCKMLSMGEKDLQCTCVPQSRSIDWPSLGECTEPGNHSHCSDLIDNGILWCTSKNSWHEGLKKCIAFYFMIIVFVITNRLVKTFVHTAETCLLVICILCIYIVIQRLLKQYLSNGFRTLCYSITHQILIGYWKLLLMAKECCFIETGGFTHPATVLWMRLGICYHGLYKLNK